MNNFIERYENALSMDQCQELCDYYERMKASGFSTTREQNEGAPQHLKDDGTIFQASPEVMKVAGAASMNSIINSAFWKHYEQFYSRKYSLIRIGDPHGVYSIRIQKTDVGGGYHLWHFEDDVRRNAGRVLVFQFFLNDVTEGGETEFLYQRVRFKPEAGTLLIWPASFTHSHRGNPPITSSKYIATGWTER